jgi:hypothetical protein
MVWPAVMAVNRGDTPMSVDLPPQQLSIGATSQAHEAQPQQLFIALGPPTTPMKGSPLSPPTTAHQRWYTGQTLLLLLQPRLQSNPPLSMTSSPV